MDNTWLINADNRAIAQHSRQSGAIGFIGGGLNDMQAAGLLTRALNDYFQREVELASFFMTHTHDDPSYKSIEYRVSEDTLNSGLSVVAIERVVTYKTFGGRLAPRQEVVRGPFVPKSKLATTLAFLNDQFGYTDFE